MLDLLIQVAMNKFGTLLLIGVITLALGFNSKPNPGIYVGEAVTVETGQCAPIVMMDRKKSVYYCSWVPLSSSDSLAEYMRNYTSKSTFRKTQDSIFISFDSIVKTYSTIDAEVFGEKRRFIELHYDPLHRVKIRGAIYPDYLHLIVTDVHIDKDTTVTHGKYYLKQ